LEPVPVFGCFLYGLEEEAMKKLAFVFAAIAVAALTGASAEELGARVGDRDMSRDRDFRAARAEFAYGEQDRGIRRGQYRGAHRGPDRVVIVKRQHR
jgi:hypothetical protein